MRNLLLISILLLCSCEYSAPVGNFNFSVNASKLELTNSLDRFANINRFTKRKEGKNGSGNNMRESSNLLTIDYLNENQYQFSVTNYSVKTCYSVNAFDISSRGEAPALVILNDLKAMLEREFGYVRYYKDKNCKKEIQRVGDTKSQLNKT